jgi:hypothetical protein
MVSYWKDTKEFFEDDGLVFITGRYDHKNQNNGGDKALGVHWGDYPQSHGILSPCVIPETTRNAILSGLLHQAVTKNEPSQVESILEAIRFFQ